VSEAHATSMVGAASRRLTGGFQRQALSSGLKKVD
jgi:hypothetical protein